jgi:hypothetical protein
LVRHVEFCPIGLPGSVRVLTGRATFVLTILLARPAGSVAAIALAAFNEQRAVSSVRRAALAAGLLAAGPASGPDHA